MSEIFFKDLNLPRPEIFLGVGSGSQAMQTGNALIEVEKCLEKKLPDAVCVVGDTNAGVSGALAASKLNIPVIHYEAGARSYDWNMPEEINRRLLDSISRFCFAPTKACLDRLNFEGRGADSFLIGDTLVECALPISKTLTNSRKILSKFGVEKNGFGLLTIHRADNSDDRARLQEIIRAVNELQLPILFPAHPRTLSRIKEFNLTRYTKGIHFLEPLPYKTFMQLIISAKFVITDSGEFSRKPQYLKKTV